MAKIKLDMGRIFGVFLIAIFMLFALSQFLDISVVAGTPEIAIKNILDLNQIGLNLLQVGIMFVILWSIIMVWGRISGERGLTRKTVITLIIMAVIGVVLYNVFIARILGASDLSEIAKMALAVP